MSVKGPDDTEFADRKSRRSHEWTSWDELGWRKGASECRVSRVTVGDESDMEAPVIFIGEFSAGDRVAPHRHPTDYVEIIISGSQSVRGEWHEAGDVRVVKAGTPYGPLIAGPDGATVLVVFRTGNMAAQWFGKSASAQRSEPAR